MSTEVKSKKRSSTGDATASVSKKVKTTKSADKPTPLKSALKKTEKAEKPAKKVAEAKPVKEQKSKTVKASKKDAAPPVEDVAVTEETAVVKSDDKPAKAKKTTKTSKPKTSKATEEETSPLDADPSTDLTPDQTAALLAGFSDSDSDSNADAEADGVDISTLPAPPTTAAVQKAIAKATSTSTSDPEKTPGTLYLGRLPTGFHEPQMRSYFSQFGTITHLKLARNPKTGKSRHFAFIEFASSAVAEIVRKTMDKYLMFGHILQVRNVDGAVVGREGFWKGSGGEGRRVMPRNRLEGARLRRGTGREEWGVRVTRESEKREQKKKALAEMGYDFQMPEVKKVDSVPVRAEEAKAIAPANGETEVVKAIEAAPEAAVVEGKVKGHKRSASKDPSAVKKNKKAKKAVAA